MEEVASRVAEVRLCRVTGERRTSQAVPRAACPRRTRADSCASQVVCQYPRQVGIVAENASGDSGVIHAEGFAGAEEDRAARVPSANKRVQRLIRRLGWQCVIEVRADVVPEIIVGVAIVLVDVVGIHLLSNGIAAGLCAVRQQAAVRNVVEAVAVGVVERPLEALTEPPRYVHRNTVIVRDAAVSVLPDAGKARVRGHIWQTPKICNKSRLTTHLAVGVHARRVHEDVCAVVPYIVHAEQGVGADGLLYLQVPLIIGWVVDVVCDGVEIWMDS